jgi:Flp pilus assembly protein TadG
MLNRHYISDGLGGLRDWCRRARPAWLRSPWQLGEDGGTLVEFTLILPFFFLLLYGIVEFGSIYYLQNSMVNVARESARGAAVQGKTPAQANLAACQWLAGTAQSYTISATDLCAGANQQADIQVVVSVDADKASLLNYLGQFTGVKFGATARYRRELLCTGTGSTVSCTCNTMVNPPTCS